ncbi:MAG TPA: hypothetical protein VG122_05900 [Gemmata sp.]|jgi:hypothetical protein|nr:hypothetical protein [Gemmata sp.]
MNFDRYSREAFEAIALDANDLRVLADQLEADLLQELNQILAERFAVMVAELNSLGHNLRWDGTPRIGDVHFCDYTNPRRCALRLGYDLLICAGFEDAWGEGGRGRRPEEDKPPY